MRTLDKRNKTLLTVIILAILFYWSIHNWQLLRGILLRILSVFSPFIFGALVALILNIIINKFEKYVFPFKENKPRYNKMRRPLTTVIAVVILLGSIVLISFVLLPLVFNSLQDFALLVPKAIDFLQNHLEKLSSEYPSVNNFLSKQKIDFTSMQNNIIDFVRNKLPNALSFTANVTTSLVNLSINFVIGFIFSIYLVLQKEKILRYLYRVLYAFGGEKITRSFRYLLNLIYKSFSGFISGQLIESIVLGCLFFVGMKLLNIPQAVTVAFIQGIAALIPMFGAIIGSVLGALIVLIAEPTKAIYFLIFSVVLIQFDANVIYPKIMGDSIGTPAILVLMSVSVFGTLFGILGMITAVPTTNVLYTLLNNKVQKEVTKRQELKEKQLKSEESP